MAVVIVCMVIYVDVQFVLMNMLLSVHNNRLQNVCVFFFFFLFVFFFGGGCSY